MTRYALSKSDGTQLTTLASAERRSIANMVSVLLTEALAARRAAALVKKK